VIGVFVQLARGLQAVHEAGFVHRDVKPDNVLVDDDGRVRLVDFGLVHRQGAAANVAGTPAYMAPEVFDGASPDPRSDQFAFAVALFEALTGERPFAGRSIIDLQLRMRAGQPTRGWQVVPASLREILRRALDARPRRRFASMAALETALLRAASRCRKTARGACR
jgi:serine/threonine protein kinase